MNEKTGTVVAVRGQYGAGNPRTCANLHEYRILKMVGGAGELIVSLLRGQIAKRG